MPKEASSWTGVCKFEKLLHAIKTSAKGTLISSSSLRNTASGKGITPQRLVAICSACPVSRKLSRKNLDSCSLHWVQSQPQSPLSFNSSPICLNNTVASSPSIPETKRKTCGYFWTKSSNVVNSNTFTPPLSSLWVIKAAAKYSWKVLWRNQYSCCGLNLFRLSSL